jgi:phospholipid/cholesterol/gamma-HCH transport system substrate-binding protein
MRLSREQKVGLFFLGGLVLFGVFIEATVGFGILRRGTALYAEFRDVQGLTAGAPVRVAGVRAGTVGEVRLEADRVRVRLDLRPGIEIRSGAVARLDFQALSGTRFVAIDPGPVEAPPLEPGARLRTEEPAGISRMVDRLAEVAESVRSLADSLNANQERVLANLNLLLEENRRSVSDTLRHVASIAEKIDRGEGTLGRLLADPSLYEQATATLAVLRESFGDVRRATRALSSGKGTLAHLLYDEELYGELRETLESLAATARNFEDISDRVASGRGTLGRLVADEGLYDETQEALRGVRRATRGIEDQAPISVLGTLLGTLF